MYYLTLHQRLDILHGLPSEEILELAFSLLPEKIPIAYLAELNEKDQRICLQASLIFWAITGSTQVPREMQLQGVVASMSV